MECYVSFVKNYVFLSAIIHFAILGTLGEMISQMMVNKNVKYPFTFFMTLKKMAVWAFLGVVIKFTFKGFVSGYVPKLMEVGYLPQAEHGSFLFAFSVSVLSNLQFGIFMVLFHRLLDNLVTGQKNWKNLDKGFLSMLWFWIPAHTITFMLPEHFQIVMASAWSVALGVLLGMFNSKSSK